jgi:hypothetical protein
MIDTTYPPEIEKYLDGIFESLVEQNFYIEEEITDFAYEATRKVAGPMLLEQWLSDGIDFEEDGWFEKMLKLIIVHGRMMSLEKKGLVGSIDDEHGEEVFFATGNGRELLKKMENK